MIKDKGTQKEKVKAIKVLKSITKYYKSNLLTKKKTVNLYKPIQ